MAFEALGYETRAPRRGPVERRRASVAGRPRRCRRRLRRRRRARRRGPAALGHVRRRARRQRLRPQRARASTTTTTSTSCAGWRACGPVSTRRRPRRPTLRGLRRLQHRPDRRRRVGPGRVRRRHPRERSPSGRRSPRSRTGASSTSFRQLPRRRARLFSWWDYRAGDFHKDQGMRIDLVLASRPLAERADVRADRPQRPQGQAARPTTPRCWSTSLPMTEASNE